MVKHPNWGIAATEQTKLHRQGLHPDQRQFFFHDLGVSVARPRSETGEFIGEESGGGYYGNTSGPGALLFSPNTKLQAYVPLMTYYMAVRDDKAASHGVLPNYPVKYTIDELLEGRDKELAVALELERKPGN